MCQLALIFCTKLNNLHSAAVYPKFRIGAHQLNSEFHAVAIQQLCLLCSSQVSLPLPAGNTVGATHILQLVIAVGIGIVQSYLILLTVFEDEGNLHGKAALLQAAVFVPAGGVILYGHSHFFIVIGIGNDC